jgi:hypothetical protein
VKQVLRQLDPLRLLRESIRHTDFYPIYKSLGHHPDYWYWVLRGRPARTPHLMKQRTVAEYAKRYRVPVLIEAGTYYGEMVDAMKSQFDEIFSIEIDHGLASLAQRRFAEYKHIHILEGDSELLIQELLSKVKQPALFWLDAGYYGWGNQKGNKNRLIVELESILSSPYEHVIVMDDAHGLNGKNGSPTVDQLTRHLNAKFPNRAVSVKHNILRIVPGNAPVLASGKV